MAHYRVAAAQLNRGPANGGLSAMRGILFALVVTDLLSPCAMHAQPKAAAPARPAVVSNSSITVSGPVIGGTRTIALPWMNNFENKGDWYVTPTDAHAGLLLSDASAMKEGRIDLELNGKQPTFVLDHGNNKNTGHKTDLWFGVMVGSAQKSTTFTLDDNDEVTLAVTRMDSLTLEATVSGTLTQAGLMERNGHDAYQVKVQGVISLHRASAPAEKSAGNYTSCDPIIHDWLNQAENRAPAECEVRFDQDVRAAMTKAFEPTYAAFAAQQWRVMRSPKTGLPDAMPRGSEKMPYRFGFGDSAAGFELAMDSGAPEFQRLKAAADAPDPGLAHVMELMKQGKYAEAQAAANLTNANRPNNALGEFRGNTRLVVTPVINQADLSIVNFHGAFAAAPLAGGGTVLYLPEAQPAGGGSSGEPMTYVLLGPWAQPGAARLDADGTRVSARATLSPSAPRLSVQTVVIGFHCSRELAQKAIQTVDWSVLRGMIGH
jgi:hypothetical protein